LNLTLPSGDLDIHLPASRSWRPVQFRKRGFIDAEQWRFSIAAIAARFF
jgi:hypothetical protein